MAKPIEPTPVLKWDIFLPYVLMWHTHALSLHFGNGIENR